MPDAARRWWVPGRLEVFGKHTDYGGGRTLVAALPRGFRFTARPAAAPTVRVRDEQDDAEVAIDLAGPSGNFSGWRRYVDVAVRRLARNFPGRVGGVEISFVSDLPRAAGMSSSSALITGVVLAVAGASRLDEQPAWTLALGSPLDLAGYCACVENGQSFKNLEGDSGVGTAGGSEDHTAMLCSREGELGMFSFVPATLVDRVPLSEAWRFVIATSGVRADKTGSARDRYNRASAGAKALLDIWKQATGSKMRSLAGALAAPGAADALRAIVRREPPAGWTADAIARRLDHFIREDARVPAAVEAFRASDCDAIGAITEASQVDARELLGNQIPETDALAQLSRQAGAFAACSFGAGFGGAVWALADADRADLVGAAWIDAYRRAYPARDAEVFVARPAAAAAEIISR